MPPRKLPRHWILYWILLGLLVSLGLGTARLLSIQISTPEAVAIDEIVSSTSSTPSGPLSVDTEAVSKTYGYGQHTIGDAIAHVVIQPPEATVSIAVANNLMTVEDFAKQTLAEQADAQTAARYIINGGFFDPYNGKTTSHLVHRGQVVSDPARNERLIENPALSQYLPQILNRSEFRVYQCQAGTLTYDITFHDALPPNGCELDSAIGAGPQLLPIDTAVAEAFVAYEGDTVVRDAVGSFGPNARSAIGLYPEGAIALIMVEKSNRSSGLTLAELADFAATLGVTKLLNLDGGSSSTLFVSESSATAGQIDSDRIYFGLFGADGAPVRRAVKSVILLEN